jgi:class 3 adenylate cyclase
MDYRKDPGLLERMPNYTVNMGFGLHYGWAIEGAIGSMFKIDASYLSPNVNMSSRLEAATRQYGVPILVSGPIYDIFTDDIKKICREVDTVTVKGSIQPIRLFTIDVDFNDMPLRKDRFENTNPREKKKIRDREKKSLMEKIFDS